MSLIKCPECGKEISSKAAICPNCGCPSSEFGAQEIVPKENVEISIEIVREIAEKYSDNQRILIIRELSEKTGANINDARKKVEDYFDSLPHEEKEIPGFPYTKCPNCGEYNPTGIFMCQKCRYRYSADDYKVLSPWKKETESILYSQNENIEKSKKEFTGVYRTTLFHGLQEVYCPRCGSENCSHFQEQKIIPGKTKTKYTANLNPLRPFTLVNKKEKVVRADEVVTESKFVCNKCGMIFK